MGHNLHWRQTATVTNQASDCSGESDNRALKGRYRNKNQQRKLTPERERNSGGGGGGGVKKKRKKRKNPVAPHTRGLSITSSGLYR